MKKLRTTARYLVGGLFIFSGLIKINDPVGTQIKLEEYFTVFAVDIAPFFDALKPMALVFSVVLSTAEIVLGLALLLRYRSALITTLLLLLIVFFTFLTFYSAYFNKVTDCGCFGDAIKLTPWQSFIKDIVLFILIMILFLHRNKDKTTVAFKQKTVVLGGVVAGCLAIALTAIAHLPFIDLRAYKTGTHIPTEMLPPAANPHEIPKITNFAVWSDEADMTREVLSGRKLLIIVHEVESTAFDAYRELVDQVNALEGRLDMMAVTASSSSQFESLRHRVQLAVPYYYSDKTLLKTMIRSNPGLVLLEDGLVLGKWHYNDIPQAGDILARFRP